MLLYMNKILILILVLFVSCKSIKKETTIKEKIVKHERSASLKRTFNIFFMGSIIIIVLVAKDNRK